MTTPSLHTPDSLRASRTPYAGPAHVSSSGDARSAGAPRPYVPVALRTEPLSAESDSARGSAVQSHFATLVDAGLEEATGALATGVYATGAYATGAHAAGAHANAAHENAAPENAAPASAAPASAAAESEHQSALEDAHDHVHADAETSMPWISDFLAAPEVAVEPEQADESASDAQPERVDDWPFADAGAQASELSIDMPLPDPFGNALLSGTTPAALPMWNDDDMMDIMPVRSMSHDDADRATIEAAEQREHSEAAARALEGVAARVRGGELALPGYAAEMGDAAALAAALAALLGVRH